MNGRTVRILSIDGGGIRGLIPSVILREIRNRLRSTGRERPFSELFDLIAGTSAGSLVALGLALPADKEAEASPRTRRGARRSGVEAMHEPLPSGGRSFVQRPALDIDDIVQLYLTRGSEIFPRHRFRSLRTVVQAFAEKYESTGLETVLRDVFGEATIQDGLTNLLITSYDTERMEPFFFKKRPRRGEWQGDLNFYMRDAARASSAAPTYFEPALVAPVPTDGRRFCLVDGGVFANNPAMCAYVEARKIFPHAKRYVLVSLSTGRTMTSFPYDEVRSWGFFEWIRPSKGTPLAMIVGAGQSECVNHQLEKLPGVEFFRIEGELLPGRDEIDDASEENLRNLELIAERMIRADSDTLDAIVTELSG